MSPAKRAAYLEAIQTCIEENSDDFNDFECTFLESMQDNLLKGYDFRGNQKPKLIEILENYEVTVNL